MAQSRLRTTLLDRAPELSPPGGYLIVDRANRDAGLRHGRTAGDRLLCRRPSGQLGRLLTLLGRSA